MSQKLENQTAPSAPDSAQDTPPTQARAPYQRPTLKAHGSVSIVTLGGTVPTGGSGGFGF